jgi:hypothetical protein
MRRLFRIARADTSGVKPAFDCILLALAAAGLFSGCVAKIQIPAVDHFQVAAGPQKGFIDAALHQDVLLSRLYALMKANEGVKVPICTASKDSKQCIKNGVSFFVWGGVIPGVGRRKYYVFSDVALDGRQIAFKKDNSSTTFLGTPVWTRSSECRVHAGGGGLQAEMTKYYANWAGIGNMYMAEGWAIDFMDLDRGILGLQLELDIKGYLTLGGGSRYIMLRFPNVPESLSRSAVQFSFLKR